MLINSKSKRVDGVEMKWAIYVTGSINIIVGIFSFWDIHNLCGLSSVERGVLGLSIGIFVIYLGKTWSSEEK